MYKVFTVLNILSSATSASDFTISNHKLLVLPLSFMLLHTILGFMPWSVGIRPSEMFQKYTNYLKDCPYWVPHYLIHHLGRYWADPWETPKWFGVSMLLCVPLFFFLLFLSHPTASPRNLLSLGWCHLRTFWNARSSWSKTCFHILPWKKSALELCYTSLHTLCFPWWQ